MRGTELSALTLMVSLTLGLTLECHRDRLGDRVNRRR